MAAHTLCYEYQCGSDPREPAVWPRPAAPQRAGRRSAIRPAGGRGSPRCRPEPSGAAACGRGTFPGRPRARGLSAAASGARANARALKIIIIINERAAGLIRRVNRGAGGRAGTWDLPPRWQPFVTYNLPKIARWARAFVS